MGLKEDIQSAKEELTALDGEIKGIGEQLKEGIGFQMEALNETTQKVAKSFQNDLGKAIERSNKSLDAQSAIRQKILKGQDASKEIEKEISKTQKERDIILRKIEGLKRAGVSFNAEEVLLLGVSLEAQESSLENLNDINTTQIANRGLSGNILENAKAYLITLDKSGLAAQLLNGNLDKAQKAALLGEAALIAIAKGALEGSNHINNLQKNLGISYGSAYQLQNSLAATANSSEKLFITSKALNESFTALAETTGILSDFGGDTLVTMTTLTKQLGLGVKEASQLSLLARTQDTDTESVLENTVDTVNAINRQNKSAISARAVLNDIASASASIVVSLGMSPELLAEAATEARGLGLSLSQVDAIAGSLLDFESSIENELAFQLLTGKEINLDKARQLALDNDLAGLSKEIGNNAAITEAFSTGNRIQQEAAAAALGMSRDSMAEMVMQQAFLNLEQDEFIEKFGEQSYLAMQSQSASDKFADSMEKVKGIITDIGTIFAPIIDGFAYLVGLLASSKELMIGLAVAVGAVAIQYAIMKRAAMQAAISGIWKSFTTLPGGIGIPLALGATAAFIAAVGKVQSVKDGIAPSDRGPFTITDAYGAMATTTAGDSLMASPNVGKGGGGNSGEMVSLLKTIANKNSDVYMDSSKVGYADALSYSKL